MNGFVFDKGIDITPVQSPMGFTYGAGVFGPEVEIYGAQNEAYKTIY